MQAKRHPRKDSGKRQKKPKTNRLVSVFCTIVCKPDTVVEAGIYEINQELGEYYSLVHAFHLHSKQKKPKSCISIEMNGKPVFWQWCFDR